LEGHFFICIIPFKIERFRKNSGGMAARGLGSFRRSKPKTKEEEMKMNAVTFGAIMLLIGGLINTLPPVSRGLANLFDGSPVAQIVVGAVSIIAGVVLFARHSSLAS